MAQSNLRTHEHGGKWQKLAGWINYTLPRRELTFFFLSFSVSSSSSPLPLSSLRSLLVSIYAEHSSHSRQPSASSTNEPNAFLLTLRVRFLRLTRHILIGSGSGARARHRQLLIVVAENVFRRQFDGGWLATEHCFVYLPVCLRWEVEGKVRRKKTSTAYAAQGGKSPTSEGKKPTPTTRHKDCTRESDNDHQLERHFQHGRGPGREYVSYLPW